MAGNGGGILTPTIGIVVKSVSKTFGDSDTLFIAVGFDTVDDDGKHVDATFSITSEEATLPMFAITPYGMLIGQIGDNTSDEITISAYDGTTAVESTNSLDALAELQVGAELELDD